MPRLSPRLFRNPPDGAFYWFCPPCDELHVFHRDGVQEWTFDGNAEAPTMSPSVKHTWTHGEAREARCCHYFIRGGQVEYCGDSTHALAGKTGPMGPLPAWVGEDG